MRKSAFRCRSVEEPAKDWRTYPNVSPVFMVFGGPQAHGHSLTVAVQNRRSCFFRLPKVPIFAMVNATRYVVSSRTPKLVRRYSRLMPQQSGPMTASDGFAMVRYQAVV